VVGEVDKKKFSSLMQDWKRGTCDTRMPYSLHQHSTKPPC